MSTTLIPTDFLFSNSEHVYLLQLGLKACGYTIDNIEFDDRIYGSTTKIAVQQFQSDYGITVSEKITSTTIVQINKILDQKYRISGFMTDSKNRPVEGVTVTCNLFNNQTLGVFLGQGISLKDGSYNIFINQNIPVNLINKDGFLKNKLSIQIIYYKTDADQITSDVLLIEKLESIFNFSSDLLFYTGESIYKSIETVLENQGVKIDALALKTPTELVNISTQTGIDKEILIKILFAYNVSELFFTNPEVEAFFGYLYQNYPANMPIQIFTEEVKVMDQTAWDNYKTKISFLIATGLKIMSENLLNEALIIACKESYINKYDKTWIDRIVLQITNTKTYCYYNSELLEGNVPLSTIIELSGVTMPIEEKWKVAEIFVLYINDFNQFIKVLDSAKMRADFKSENVDKLINTFNISRIFRNFKNSIIKFQTLHQPEIDLYTYRFLGTIDKTFWKNFVSTSKFPSDLSEEEYVELIIDSIQKICTDISTITEFNAFPEFQHLSTIQTELLKNKNFNLLSDRAEILKNDPKITDEIINEVKSIQNIYRITPSPKVATIMYKNGVKNAGDVYFIGKRQLEDQFKNDLTQQEIDSVFEMASARFSNSLNAFANFNNAFNNLTPASISKYDINSIIDELREDFPDIETLFGKTDYCECDHDTSVYSIAAYLGDLLAFIDTRKTSPSSNTPLKSVLDQRRSDLSQIYLNKENSNTVLPYIDLVNEVLEEAVLKTEYSTFSRNCSECQTTLSSKDLCAAPEHILFEKVIEENLDEKDVTAYDILAEQYYPMNSSFNLSLTESRSYLQKMGINRYELMECFQSNYEGSVIPSNIDIATEYFNLTIQDKNIITANSTDITTRNSVWHKFLDPAGNIQRMNTFDFMKDTGLSFYEVLDILESDWIGLSGKGITVDCSYKNKIIEGTEIIFDRAHRFIRLYKKSGWKIWELDQLLRSTIAVDNTYYDRLNIETIYNLMLFKRQQIELNLSCDELLTFYQDMKCVEDYENGRKIPCLYQRTFLNKSLSNPLNQHLLDIYNDPTKIFTTDDHPLIAASLTVSTNDIETLISYYKSITSQTVAHDFEALNFIYRNVLLSEKLKISVSELLILKKLCQINNLQYSINETQTLTDTNNKINNFNIDFNDYNFLINQIINLNDSTLFVNEIEKLKKSFCVELLPPTSTQILENPYIVNTKYRTIFTDYLLQIDRFSKIETIETLIQIIENSTDRSDSQIDEFIRPLFPEILGIMLNATNLHHETISDKTTLIKRYQLVTDYINNSSNAISIQTTTANIFDLPSEILNPFILQNIDLSTDTETRLGTTLLKELSNIDNYSGEKEWIRICLYVCQKFNFTIKKIDITVDDFKLLFNLSDDNNTIDFEWNYFKHSSGSTSNTIFQYLELIQLLQLRIKYGSTKEGKNLLSIILSNRFQTDVIFIINDLCKLTGWDYNDILNINEHFSILYTDYSKTKTYQIIEESLSFKKITNSSLETLYKWGKIIFYTEDQNKTEKQVASEIKEATKAHYDIDNWIDNILPEIQNPIREQKSNALASFLIAFDLQASTKKGWNDRIDLYKYFLLDTEMSSMMKTSRIVQATCSIQQFVQRCLLNLESEVVIDENSDGEWKQWEWMRKYRLWEANRKIFLYPENWIEPELRDDKTPFFKELEEDVNQSDVTEEQVETAFENYLHKLQTVSNLTICGIYREVVDNNQGLSLNGMELKTEKVDNLHVIAKTKSSPIEYYYRSYDALNARWSYWEKIELDIKGENIIPFVYNRKLYLFWLLTTEKSYNNSEYSTSSVPDKYTEIQLGWSCLKNKKWSPVQYSQKKHLQYKHYNASDYSLIAYYDSVFNELIFTIYNLYYLNTNNPREYHSCDTQSGVFYFDGDVYKVVSNINHFISNHIQSDIDHLNSLTITGAGNLRIGSLSGAKYENGLKKIDEEKLQLFNKLSSGIEAEMKSMPINLDDVDSSIYPVRSIFRASKLYPMEKELDNYIIYLHDVTSQDFYSTRILTTSNQQPNLVSMVHSMPSFWHAMYFSHLVNPMFYQDTKKSFFVKPVNVNLNDWKAEYKFYPFYHPYTNLFIKELNREGIGGLLNRDLQIQPQNFFPQNNFNFDDYNPAQNVKLDESYQTDINNPHDIIDFNLSGAYGSYNWELFFHIPFYIACKLSQNQKYEEAMSWFHYIFNPTDKTSYTSPQKYWVFKPFFTLSTPENRAQEIRNVLNNIEEHVSQVNEWLNNPYKPHLVARTRPVAYQKAVVMKYIDNIVAWADQLFRQDSMESNNEATLLYMLAYEILGKRPEMIPQTNSSSSFFNYEMIKNSTSYNYLSVFDNSFKYSFKEKTAISCIARPDIAQPAFYQQKSDFIKSATSTQKTTNSKDIVLPQKPQTQCDFIEIKAQEQAIRIGYTQKVKQKPLPRIDADHFCIPFNENLLSFWNTVEDRLFKLRHCMNIDGVVRELPLFEPPIDPALLVKAAAAGLSIGDALNETTASLPYYRFRVILQKALEFSNEVKQFGDKLLSTIEKKDAETLNLLRNNQEISLQKSIKQLKKLQIEEAKQQIESINETINNTQFRYNYYTSRAFMNSFEMTSYMLSEKANDLNLAASNLSSLSSILNLIPQFDLGGAGACASPYVVTSYGGIQISSSINAAASVISTIAQTKDRKSSLMSIIGGYNRRKEEWNFQADTAKLELNQLNKQLTASEIRLMIAEKELENFEIQIEQSQSVKEYYQNKFSNDALYNWMITQVSSLYFDAYKLAYDMAKKAEKCYQHELGIYEAPKFIQFNNWNSLKKGLLSGDKLIQDLHRLDAAYLNNNQRTLELTKHISLAQMFPNALLSLIANKEVELEIPEFIFDLDYPGHYKRRIKSVSVTIPNTSGPYSTVNFMLTLSSAKVRKNTFLTGNDYIESSDGNDDRFVYQVGGSESICTSSAQNDSGLFELNFGDERYLPFENAGVISKWKLRFPAHYNNFDISTVSDIIMHINYTALYDQSLVSPATKAIADILPTYGVLLLSPKQDFPDSWSQINPDQPAISIGITSEYLPFLSRGIASTLAVNKISVVLTSYIDKINPNITITLDPISEEISPTITLLKKQNGGSSETIPENGNIYLYEGEINLTARKIIGNWNIHFNNIIPSEVENLIFGFTYIKID